MSTTAMRSAYSAYRCDTSKMSRVVFWGYPSGLLVAAPTVPAWEAFSTLMQRHNYGFRESAGGTYNCRQIAGSSSYSLHSYGLAVDLNPSKNPHRVPLTTDIPKPFRDDVNKIATVSGRQVFQWGGEWSKPDAMHFQIGATPTELATGLIVPDDPGEIDMPLTDDDVQRIAKAVWQFEVDHTPGTTDGEEKSPVRQMWRNLTSQLNKVQRAVDQLAPGKSADRG